ncbi:DNA-binding protein [Agrobacterium sp. CNPSo 2736]|uniref:DNA-binding protein n=1 Tax=Agrobacterium sp. CNPSo 2736 TaxID=2499627 RepID=UPI000FD890EB|nr:DNA-binding protein [Agrobacterium sp. CNPSo 2736]RVT80196.1 DNA-binding protein [Agrobacterium sp. CNPSo 2736]
MSDQDTDHINSSDLVWGGAAIAKIIERTERVTFDLLEKNQLPAKKVGGRWVASRRKLIAFLTDAAQI